MLDDLAWHMGWYLEFIVAYSHG